MVKNDLEKYPNESASPEEYESLRKQEKDEGDDIMDEAKDDNDEEGEKAK